MQKYNFSYDEYNDDLFIYKAKSKSKGSVELGDLIFDFNNKKELVGIEIINVSKFLVDLTGENLANVKHLLLNLNHCDLNTINRNNLMIVKLTLSTRLKEISSNITVPSITTSSPALATA